MQCAHVPARSARCGRRTSGRLLPAARRPCVAAPVCAPVLARPRACVRPCVCACVRAWPRLLPLFASFYSPIMYILRRYARPACRVSAPPQTFLRSFSGCRYLFSCRPRGWVARLDVAIWADLAVLRCFYDLLTSRDIKKIFFKGLTASAHHAMMYTSTGKTHTTDGYKQGKHDRPTSECESPTDARKRVTDGRAEASERTANSGSKSTEPLQVHRRSTHGRTSQRWRPAADIVVYPDLA